MRLLTQFVAAVSSLTIPHILLCSLLLNVPSLFSPLTVSDLVSHPCNTTGKISFVYFLLVFFDNKREDKILLNG